MNYKHNQSVFFCFFLSFLEATIKETAMASLRIPGKGWSLAVSRKKPLRVMMSPSRTYMVT